MKKRKIIVEEKKVRLEWINNSQNNKRLHLAHPEREIYSYKYYQSTQLLIIKENPDDLDVPAFLRMHR